MLQNPIHTPNKSIIKAEANNDTYFITTDKNNITFIEKQETTPQTKPKTYDELMQRQKRQDESLESIRNQYVEIAEIKEKEAQKQLLLEYKPEIKETSVKELPTKSNLERDLTQQEIKETIDKWDLTKPNANDKLIISKVEQDELELLKKDFDFKGNYAVVREIDAEHLAHALNRHSDEAIETSRNQIPITKDEALDYQSIIKTHDTREVSGNHIVYKKQINGHYVAVEEVLTGKNKLRFVTMWKSRGNITTAPTPSSKGYDLDRTLSGSYEADIIPQNPTKAQSEYFNPFMNEYEKIKEIKKLHTQDDNLIRVMKVEGRNDYIEPLSNMSVSKEYLQSKQPKA